MRWGILFGVLVTMVACGGKSDSDDDSSASGDDAGQGGSGATGTGGSGATGKGGSGTTASGGSSARGGTSSAGGASATGGAVSNGGTGVGGTSGTAGMPAGGSAGTGVDPVCTDLSTQAPAAEISFAGDGTPPVPAGGTFQSGTYYLALETFYGTSADCQAAADSFETIDIELIEVVRFVAETPTSGRIEIALELSTSLGGDATRATGAGTYATSGNTLTVTSTCGDGSDGAGEPAEYTMTGDQLVLFSSTDDSCDSTVAYFQRF
jgi:hypothetical protein